MTDYRIASQRQYKRNYECYNAQEYKRKLKNVEEGNRRYKKIELLEMKNIIYKMKIYQIGLKAN